VGTTRARKGVPWHKNAEVPNRLGSKWRDQGARRAQETQTLGFARMETLRAVLGPRLLASPPVGYDKKRLRISADRLPGLATALTTKIRRYNLLRDNAGFDAGRPRIAERLSAITEQISHLRRSIPFVGADDGLARDIEELSSKVGMLAAQVRLLRDVNEVAPQPKYARRIQQLRDGVASVLETVSELTLGGVIVDIADRETELLGLPPRPIPGDDEGSES